MGFLAMWNTNMKEFFELIVEPVHKISKIAIFAFKTCGNV